MTPSHHSELQGGTRKSPALSVRGRAGFNICRDSWTEMAPRSAVKPEISRYLDAASVRSAWIWLSFSCHSFCTHWCMASRKAGSPS